MTATHGTVFRSPPGMGAFPRGWPEPPPVVRCPNPATGARWAKLVEELERAVPERSFRLWLEPHLHPHRLHPDGTLELGFPAAVGEGAWFVRRYRDVIEACAGRPVRIVMCDRGVQR